VVHSFYESFVYLDTHNSTDVTAMKGTQSLRTITHWPHSSDSSEVKAPAFSALQLLESVTTSLQLSECEAVLTPYIVTSTPTISRRPFWKLT